METSKRTFMCILYIEYVSWLSPLGKPRTLWRPLLFLSFHSPSPRRWRNTAETREFFEVKFETERILSQRLFLSMTALAPSPGCLRCLHDIDSNHPSAISFSLLLSSLPPSPSPPKTAAKLLLSLPPPTLPPYGRLAVRTYWRTHSSPNIQGDYKWNSFNI